MMVIIKLLLWDQTMNYHISALLLIQTRLKDLDPRHNLLVSHFFRRCDCIKTWKTMYSYSLERDKY